MKKKIGFRRSFGGIFRLAVVLEQKGEFRGVWETVSGRILF